MSKIFTVFISFISLLHIALPMSAAQNTPLVSCTPQLQSCLQMILQIPEAKDLVNSIQKEGPIQIVAKGNAISKQFGAFWDPDRRIICVDVSSHRTDGMKIGSLLFELHNASTNSKIDHLNDLAHQRKIDKKSYVEAMEYIEYINSLNTSKIAAKGIHMGILPFDAKLPTYPNFKEHLKAQIESGHSACFEHNYRVCL